MRQFWYVAVSLSVLLVIQTGCQRGHSVADVDGGDSTTNVAVHHAAPASPTAGEFESPVRIEAGGEVVSVGAPGYACPTMADVDGDGSEDLVVGQFRDGNMQFCRNIAATGEPPKFAAATWLMTGDSRAVVPGVW